MTGYAVAKDNTYYRAVDGPFADPDNPLKVFPDPDTEFYSEHLPDDPVLSIEQVLSSANSKRDSLLSIAALRIAPLQDAIDLGDATSLDKEKIKQWKQYRVLVNRVSEQDNFPENIIWPDMP